MKSPSSTAPFAPATSTSSSKKVRYALIGLGHIAQTAIIPGFNQTTNSELAALVSSDNTKLRILKKRHPEVRTFTDDELQGCLQDPKIDAVYIALPNDMHRACALQAARAGKHILCEKPLALDAREASEMVRTAAAHKVKLMTAYRLHFEPANLASLALIRSGRLGDPRHFSSTFSYQITDRDNIRLQAARGGGPVYDIGTYCINAARMLMEDEPIEVSAFLARNEDARFDEVEETASVMLRFPRGRLASFVVSFGADTTSRYEFVCTKGRVVLDPAYEYSDGLQQTVTIDGKKETRHFPHVGQFGGEIEAFSHAILNDRKIEPSGEEGVADARVIDAIFQSATTGRAIRLAPTAKVERPTLRQEKRKPAAPEPRTVHADAPYTN